MSYRGKPEQFRSHPHSFDAFMQHFGVVYTMPPEIAQEIYDRWLCSFFAKLISFYPFQFTRHERWARQQFKYETGIDPDIEDTMDEDASVKFNDYMEDVCRDHLTFVDKELDQLYVRCSDLEQRWHARPDLDRHSMLAIDADRDREDELDGQGPSRQDIDAWWFNTTLLVNIAEQRKLRALAYQDYISTEHWRQVRAALILLNRCRCQARSCQGLDSAYGGGWERHIHVHHRHYRNLGNERYEDIVMLCDTHHEAWHQVNNGRGQPPFEIVYVG
jgi:hypothetical protein